MHMIDRIRAALAGAALALACVAAPALAATPEDDYLAARDAAVARFKAIGDANGWNDDTNKAHDAALAELRTRLQAVVGTVAIRGLPATPANNLETLSPGDQGFGTLDGLLFASNDGKTSVIVTTRSLFDRWLVRERDWADDKGRQMESAPRDAAAAIRTETFYTQAIRTDAAVMRFAELPVVRPAGAEIVDATLAGRSQDEPPNAPDEIFVTAVKGSRVFVAVAPVQGKFPRIPACDAARRKQQKAAEAAWTRYEAGGRTDAALGARVDDLREQAPRDFLDCFQREAGKQAAFAGAVQQAQALLERLPLK